MDVDRGLLQIAVAEENLDGAQVGAGLQQMGGEAVTEEASCGIVATMPPPGLCRKLI